MKLASLKAGRDGRIAVVSRDLSRYLLSDCVLTVQQALDDWDEVLPGLQALSCRLEDPRVGEGFSVQNCVAPLPRAFQWVDGSAYVNHVELVRKARGAVLPESYWSDPLVYQGGSDDFTGPTGDIGFPSEACGIDLEAEIAVITGDVGMGTTAAQVQAQSAIRLVMLVNDWSLRELIPAELAKGFGFYQSKPATSFSPVAVTVDELGEAWDGRRVQLPLMNYVNNELLGSPNAGVDMTFDFPSLLEHCVKTRRLRAGTIVGSGTVSNYDRSRGSACLAERRMLEILEFGAPRTAYLKFGDRIRIEMLDSHGQTIFGAIDQRVVRATDEISIRS